MSSVPCCDYSLDQAYQGYLRFDPKANRARLINAVDLTKQIGKYLLLPLRIATLIVLTVASSIVALIPIIASSFTSPKNRESLRLIAFVCLDVSWIALVRLGFALCSLILKVSIFIGLLGGILSPEMGRKTRFFEKSIEHFFDTIQQKVSAKIPYNWSTFVEDLKKELGSPSLSRDEAFKILNLPEGSTNEEITRAYRKLALQFHPDKNPSPDAGTQFDRIAKAYQLLTGKA